jgi:RHS repeat-associated protein
MIFAYNERGRLCRIDKGKEVLAELQYNYKSQRVIEKNGDKAKVFVYDANDRVLGEYGNQVQGNREYIYWEEMPVAFIQDGKLFYYHYDPMNFPVIITDGNGKLIRKVSYKPYGEIAVIKGEFIDTLHFPGQFKIEGTEFIYNLNRTYDFKLGRFIEPDSLMNYENNYQYGNCNPIKFIDINGLYCYNASISFKQLSFFKVGTIIRFLGWNIKSCDCFEYENAPGKNNKYKMVEGKISGWLGGLSASLLDIKGWWLTHQAFEANFYSRTYPSLFPYPTVDEFQGPAFLGAFTGSTLGLGGSAGSFVLGHVESSGLSLVMGTPDAGGDLAFGYCWAESDRRECCGEK